MDFTLSRHATDAIRERNIRIEWITETMNTPIATEPDPSDDTLMHALRPIAEFDSRVLRVIYNRLRTPPHIVTVYFDRAMKGSI